MKTTNDWRALVYANQADADTKRSERDPIQGAMTRTSVPWGRRWSNFHPGQELVWIDDMDGKPVALTPTQARVAGAVLAILDQATTMRAIALDLKVSPSTVSRAMVKLASFGIIAYVSSRGRYASTIIVRRVKNDGLDRFREAAKATVRSWYLAAHRHLLRSKSNVATRYSWKEIESHGFGNVYVDVMDATLTRPWTPDDLREAGII